MDINYSIDDALSYFEFNLDFFKKKFGVDISNLKEFYLKSYGFVSGLDNLFEIVDNSKFINNRKGNPNFSYFNLCSDNYEFVNFDGLNNVKVGGYFNYIIPDILKDYLIPMLIFPNAVKSISGDSYVRFFLESNGVSYLNKILKSPVLDPDYVSYNDVSLIDFKRDYIKRFNLFYSDPDNYNLDRSNIFLDILNFGYMESLVDDGGAVKSDLKYSELDFSNLFLFRPRKFNYNFSFDSSLNKYVVSVFDFEALFSDNEFSLTDHLLNLMNYNKFDDSNIFNFKPSLSIDDILSLRKSYLLLKSNAFNYNIRNNYSEFESKALFNYSKERGVKSIDNIDFYFSNFRHAKHFVLQLYNFKLLSDVYRSDPISVLKKSSNRWLNDLISNVGYFDVNSGLFKIKSVYLKDSFDKDLRLKLDAYKFQFGAGINYLDSDTKFLFDLNEYLPPFKIEF